MALLSQLRARLSRISEKECFLFILLIGLLPAIHDFSLFALAGFSMTDLYNYQTENEALVKWLYFLPLILFPFGLFLVIRSKHYDRLLGLLPYLFSILLWWTIRTELLLENLRILTILHFVCYKVAFLFFVDEGRVRSWPFLLMLAILWFALDWQHLVLFTTYTLLVKFIYLAIKQNLAIFKETGVKRSLGLVLKSIFYWSPLLLFIIPSAIISNKVEKKSIDSIYAEGLVISTDSINRYKRVQFQRDMIRTVDFRMDTLRMKIDESTARIKAASKEKANDLPYLAGEVYYDVVPDSIKDVIPGLEAKECFPLNLFCHAKNAGKGEMQRGWRNQRRDGHEKLEDNVREMAGSANDSIQKLASNTEALVAAKTEDVKLLMRKTLMGIFDGVLFFNLLMDILFGFIIVKSFLYVFSRVAFSSRTKNYISLLAGEDDMPRGSLKKCKNQYTIAADCGTHFYVSRSFEPSGRAPKFVIPQFTKAALGRIFTNNYAMNKIVVGEGYEDVYFRAKGGQEFVEWELAEGEEVVFRFKDFVGMSEGIQLSAVISMRLTSLLLGKIIFTTAKGPGKLILLTTGKPILAGEEKANTSVASSRILAWQRNTRFQVESEVNLVDVFMSGIYFKKQEADLILIDADVKGRAKSGIVKFIKSFLLPV